MKKNKFLIVVLILVLLVTVKSWLAFYVNELLFCATSAILLLAAGYSEMKATRYSLVLSFWIIVACLLFTRGNAFAYMGALIYVSPFVLFCFLSREARVVFLTAFNKVFAVIMAISVTFWILHLLGMPLLHTFVAYGERYQFDNYFFFLRTKDYLGIEFFPRFYSIIIEPGDLACILSLLIFLDGYKFNRWYNVVYLISLILTFSLAGYFLFILGIIPYLYYSKIKARLLIIAGLVAVVFVFNYAINANENSVIYQMLGQRLIEDEDRGTITGYNRSGIEMNDFFNESFWQTDKIWFGYGLDMPYGGVDIKVFIVKYGLVTLIAYLVFLALAFIKQNSKFGLWYLALFFLIFFKGYSMLNYAGMLMLFISGLDWCSLKQLREQILWPTK